MSITVGGYPTIVGVTGSPGTAWVGATNLFKSAGATTSSASYPRVDEFTRTLSGRSFNNTGSIPPTAVPIGITVTIYGGTSIYSGTASASSPRLMVQPYGGNQEIMQLATGSNILHDFPSATYGMWGLTEAAWWEIQDGSRRINIICDHDVSVAAVDYWTIKTFQVFLEYESGGSNIFVGIL